MNFPIEQNIKLSYEGELLKDPSQYRQFIGCIIYLIITQSNITYLINVSSRFMHTTCKQYMEATLLVLQYLKTNLRHGLFFLSQNDLSLQAFCDSDWAGYPISHKTTTDYCDFLESSFIS